MLKNRHKEHREHLSILDAVETLSSIADIEFEREIDVANREEIDEQDAQVIAHTVNWLESQDREHAVKHIKETFHVVHDYLRDFYEHEHSYIGKPKIIEGVKTIMVLVGEAAKKLDHYTSLFKETKEKSVKNLTEYRDLQEFYLTRIARKIDEGILGKWIFELTKEFIEKRKTGSRLKAKPILSVKHIFIDLESVKNDTEYELFFLRKEDGTRFFNPRLIRNIKLTADFGAKIPSKQSYDPLDSVNIWQDYLIHTAAKNILRAQGSLLDKFFHEAKQSWRRELASQLYKAVIALLMCCCEKNLLSQTPTKSCTEYFVDFHYFLRSIYNTREYQRFLVYPPRKSSYIEHILMDLTHRLSRALFTEIKGYQELVFVYEQLHNKAKQMQSQEHQQAAEALNMFWSQIASDYVALNKLMRCHPNGPLIKILKVLDHGTYHVFDPIAQLNLPNRLFSIYYDQHKMTDLYLPSPTNQGFIHEADIVNEFKGFLRSYSRGQFIRKHLLFNFQDRTSWKEHIRSVGIEQFSEQRLFSKNLCVVTLPKDTDFYHQLGSYEQDHKADEFINHFIENLEDESCGYFFPLQLKKKLFPKYINELINGVHKLFFSNKNVLSVKDRLDFIEIFYIFLQLKILELEQPSTFSMTCKDGIDIGSCAGAELFVFLMLVNHKQISHDEYMEFCAMLFLPALLLRERAVTADRFSRMVNALKKVETTQYELGRKGFKKGIEDAFGKIFKTPILHADVLFETR